MTFAKHSLWFFFAVWLSACGGSNSIDAEASFSLTSTSTEAPFKNPKPKSAVYDEQLKRAIIEVSSDSNTLSLILFGEPELEKVFDFVIGTNVSTGQPTSDVVAELSSGAGESVVSVGKIESGTPAAVKLKSGKMIFHKFSNKVDEAFKLELLVFPDSGGEIRGTLQGALLKLQP